MVISTTIGAKKNEYSKSKRNSFLIFFLSIAIVGLIASNVYFVLDKSDNEGEKNKIEVNAADSEDKKIQAESILGAFSEVYEIPIDEEPTVINIVDINKLKEKEPDFYANARNGDKVIVLFSKKIAFIFRQEELKIINVAPVVIDANEGQ